MWFEETAIRSRKCNLKLLYQPGELSIEVRHISLVLRTVFFKRETYSAQSEIWLLKIIFELYLMMKIIQLLSANFVRLTRFTIRHAAEIVSLLHSIQGRKLTGLCKLGGWDTQDLSLPRFRWRRCRNTRDSLQRSTAYRAHDNKYACIWNMWYTNS